MRAKNQSPHFFFLYSLFCLFSSHSLRLSLLAIFSFHFKIVRQGPSHHQKNTIFYYYHQFNNQSIYFFEEYVDEKVEEWVAQVTRLAEFATTQPQSSYAAFVFGLRHRWTYFLRTLPDIAPFLEPLESAIADLLVPAITEHVTTQEERDLLELPVRLGGLGLVNPARTASQEYEASVKITGSLVRQIIKQAHEPPDETEIKTL